MRIQRDERQRCGECGKECAELLLFSRGPPICLSCIREADRLLTPPLSAAELQRIRRMLDPYVPPSFFAIDPAPFDEDAYKERIARRMQNPNDDLVLGVRLANCND